METPKELEDLPEENDPEYPQEDKKYFKNKKYVRTDKYKLSDMLYKELELPSIRSAYSNNN